MTHRISTIGVWNQVVDHYYLNVRHTVVTDQWYTSLREWLRDNYGVTYQWDANRSHYRVPTHFEFESEDQLTMFALLWT